MSFNKFKGIQKEREVAVKEKTNLELLLEFEKKMVEKYRNKPMEDRRDGMILRQKMHVGLLEMPDFNEEDLRDYVLSRTNREDDVKELALTGTYSGCLLSLLTERNKAKGKRTMLYLDGNGNTFDYLFVGARHFDTLVLENFKGNAILAYSCNSGTANTLICKNIKSADFLAHFASFRGSSKIAIVSNSSGLHAYNLYGAGSANGSIDVLIGNNISADYSLQNIGKGGTVRLLAVKNATGKGALMGSEPKKLLVAERVKGSKKASCGNRMDDILALTGSINRKNYQEKISEIEAIYEEIKIAEKIN